MQIIASTVKGRKGQRPRAAVPASITHFLASPPCIFLGLASMRKMESDPSSVAELVAKAVSLFDGCLASIAASQADPRSQRDSDQANSPSPGTTPILSKEYQIQFAEYHWIENRLADFNLWTEGVGALGKDGASLDSRFASRPHNLAPVKTILTLLISSLIAFAASLQSGQPSQDVRDGINSCLDTLALIGVAIRLTGRKSRLQKYDGRFDSSKFNELRRYLEILCSRQFVDPACTDLGLSHQMTTEDRVRRLQFPALTAAQRRLVEANLRRRNRFMQSYNHSKGLQPRISLLPSKVEETTHTGSHTHNTEPSQVMSTRQKNTGEVSKSTAQDAPSVSGTLASEPDGSLYLGSNDTRHPAAPRRPATVLTALTGSVIYPKPPKITEGMHLFKCPGCFHALPVEIAQGKESWK